MYSIGTIVAAAEADPQITQTIAELPPCAQGNCDDGWCIGLTFSIDGGRLFAMVKGGSRIPVHNVQHEHLPVVQVLPFAVGPGEYSHRRLVATDTLLSGVEGLLWL